MELEGSLLGRGEEAGSSRVLRLEAELVSAHLKGAVGRAPIEYIW